MFIASITRNMFRIVYSLPGYYLCLALHLIKPKKKDWFVNLLSSLFERWIEGRDRSLLEYTFNSSCLSVPNEPNDSKQQGRH